MFGSSARKVTKTKSSLPALQELPSHQELAGNQVNTAKKPSRWSRFGEFKVETKKTQGTDHMENTTKKRRGPILIPRKINPHELRDQELKIEEDKRAKRKFPNWKRRQQQKLDKNTEVLDVSEFLLRKVPKGTKKKRRSNTREQKTNKVVQEDIETTYISEAEDFCILCLEKRQQFSSAVILRD